MESTTATASSVSQSEQQSFHPSNEIIGFEKASILLIIGCICIFLVLIFGIILCRLDISSGKKHRPAGHYIEH